MTKIISDHEGAKFLRKIIDAKDPSSFVYVDVYAVLDAFNVTCPARAQAVKKLLCCGNRGKGDELADLLGTEAAVARAIELQRIRNGDTKLPPPDEVEQLRNERVYLQSLLKRWYEAEWLAEQDEPDEYLINDTKLALGIP